MIVRADFSELSPQVAPGEYRAVIRSVEQRVSQAGRPYLEWSIAVQYNGREVPIRHGTPLSGAGVWRLSQLLNAVGINVQGGLVDFDTSHVLGREVMVTIENREWEGQTRPEIVRIVPVSGAPVPAPAAGQAPPPPRAPGQVQTVTVGGDVDVFSEGG